MAGMRLLLDTHVLIWLHIDPARVPSRIFEAIESEENEKSVSAATIWEIEIKRRSGRLRTPPDLAQMTSGAGFLELPVRFSHAVAAGALPLLHGDPFDRMLVAQAQVEDLRIVTADPQIARYEVATLPA
jgi:PIN domain nuclease of toxin-antitoxin system